MATAEELQAAVAGGVQNIELRAHIDLSDSPPVAIPSPTTTGKTQYVLLGIAPISVKSIRVRSQLFIQPGVICTSCNSRTNC